MLCLLPPAKTALEVFHMDLLSSRQTFMALFFFSSHYSPGVFYELVCINLTLSINRSLKDQEGVIFLVGGGGWVGNPKQWR